MSIKFLGGTTAANDSYTGEERSITIDTDTWEVRLHDGVTAGGFVIGDVSSLPVATQTDNGLMSSSDKTKLDGIEGGAEANQTDSEIKTQYEANLDTNAFTDSEQTKLFNIEANAEVNTVTSVATKTGDVTLTASDISNLEAFIEDVTGISKVAAGEYSLAGNLEIAGTM